MADEMLSSIADQICGCANRQQHARDVALLREAFTAARAEGVKAGIEAATKAFKAAQYEPAPYTTGMGHIAKLDPERIARLMEGEGE